MGGHEANHVLQRLHGRHKPSLRLRRSLYVLHPHLRDEEARRRHESCLHTAVIRHTFLHLLRRGLLLVPGRQCRVTGLLKSAHLVAEDRVWSSDTELSHRWCTVCTYCQ